MFECKVVEDGYEGTGTLDVLNDVVPFFPGDVSMQSFEYQAVPLLLRAYVKNVKSDGTYEFAMRDMISEYEDDVRVTTCSTTPDSPVWFSVRFRVWLEYLP